MIAILAAVEHDLGNSLGGGAFGELLAYRLRRGNVCAGLEGRTYVLFHRRSRGERLAFAIVDELGVDVLRRAEHGKARAAIRRGLDGLADAALTPCGSFVELWHLTHHHFFLPSLRKMNSPADFTPLPLYGSGPRNARISAATCPTRCLSVPVITISVGFGVTIAIPSGIG